MSEDRSLRASGLAASEVLSRVYELCHGPKSDDDRVERLANLQDWLAEQDLDDASLGDLADAWSGIERESEAPESEW